MNICFVLSNFGHGGAERVVSIISSELARRGHHIFICLTDRDPLVFYKIADDIEMSLLPTGSFINECLFHKSKRKIERYFDDKKIDIVVSMSTGVGSIIAPICRKKRIAYVHAERSDPNHTNSTVKAKIRWSILVRNASCIYLSSSPCIVGEASHIFLSKGLISIFSLSFNAI